jgi:alpha-tubulin suppressor-like RCC1 family protein
MLREIGIRGPTAGAACVLLLCFACESQKTLEPVRQTAIVPTSSETIQGIESSALPDDVVVRVVDQRGNPMRNAQVTWTAAEGTITPSSTTDDNGEARARWTLGPTLGPQVATAKTGTLSTQVTANATGIWKSIQVAYTGGCGLTKSNTALCWGTNEAGQLGTGAAGSPGQVLVPTPVSTSQKFQELHIAYAHVCGITTQGATLCWGLNGNGQLGVPTSTTPNCPSIGLPCTANVTTIPASPALTSLTLGFRHTCGLSAGTVYCWGLNTSGQLGIGTIDGIAHPTPTAVTGGLTFASISAGFDYTCGVTTSGQGYCWGDNVDGELGIGTRTSTGTPTPVSGNLSFAAIFAGSGFTTCGVTVNQLTYCWGLNDSGQLGNGVTDSLSATPSRVSGSQVFASVSPANFHTCGIATNGAAYCWGGNPDGQLGIGQQTPPNFCGPSLARCSRTPLAVTGGYSFTNLNANNFNTCAVTTLGGAFCWGLNDAGEFANGTMTPSGVPVQVTNPKGIPLP